MTNEEIIQLLIKYSGIPKGYQNKTVSDFQAKSALTSTLKSTVVKYVNEFSENNGAGLYIYSEQNGTGKTHLSCAAGIAIIKKYQSLPRFITVTEMTNKIKQAFDTNKDILKKYRECDLLIFDDFGSEKVTEWTEETVFSVLDYREKNILPTIFTSNLKVEDLKYNNRIKSRIRGNTASLKAGNIDHRKLK